MSPTLAIVLICSSSLSVMFLHSDHIRAASKVNMLTADGTHLDWTGDLVAAPRVQATEPQAGFHIAQSSYGTELWAAAASFD